MYIINPFFAPNPLKGAKDVEVLEPPLGGRGHIPSICSDLLYMGLLWERQYNLTGRL